MASAANSLLTCPNCGASVKLTGIEELDAYLKRGWAIVYLPREIADQIEGHTITRQSAVMINGLLQTREPDAELQGDGDSAAPAEHLLMVGAVSGKTGAGKGGPEYQATCSCTWKGRQWPKRSDAQEDGINHRKEALGL